MSCSLSSVRPLHFLRSEEKNTFFGSNCSLISYTSIYCFTEHPKSTHLRNCELSIKEKIGLLNLASIVLKGPSSAVQKSLYHCPLKISYFLSLNFCQKWINLLANLNFGKCCCCLRYHSAATKEHWHLTNDFLRFVTLSFSNASSKYELRPAKGKDAKVVTGAVMQSAVNIEPMAKYFLRCFFMQHNISWWAAVSQLVEWVGKLMIGRLAV